MKQMRQLSQQHLNYPLALYITALFPPDFQRGKFKRNTVSTDYMTTDDRKNKPNQRVITTEQYKLILHVSLKKGHLNVCNTTLSQT